MQKHLSPLRKIYTSTPFLVIFSFLFIALLFTVMHQPTKSHSSATAIFWFEFITKGIPAGLLFTLFAQLRAKNYGTTLGIKQEQVPQLKEALHTGVLPKDKKLRAALPAYMYNTYSWSKPRSKNIAVFLVIIFGINFLSDIGQHSVLKIALDIIIVAAIVRVYMSIRKKAPIVASFYEQLGVDPESAKPAMPKMRRGIPIQWKSGFVHMAKSLLTVASAVFGTALLSVAIGEGIISPWIIMSIWVPLGLVGILYLVPYFVLSGRWARGYCVLLALATVVAIRQLHIPLGHSHHVGAQAPVPAGGHSVAVYTIWAIMHSTVALIVTSAIVILAVVFVKKRERAAEKDLWMIFATAGVALTLLSFGFSWAESNRPQDQGQTSVSQGHSQSAVVQIPVPAKTIPSASSVPQAKTARPVANSDGTIPIKGADSSLPVDAAPTFNPSTGTVVQSAPPGYPDGTVIVVPKN